jgi:type VII secretion-associated serine protease mycosin
MRLRRIVLVAMTAIPAMISTAATPANATPAALVGRPTCATPGPIGQAIAAVPWAQQLYGPQRLTGIASGAGVTVAVIDSGVDADHPQLGGRVRPGRDFLGSGDGRTDCVGHGTAVASIIAAGERAGVGFRGLAPQVDILPIRVTERRLVDAQADGAAVGAGVLADAIDWAVDHHASVINLSLTTTADLDSLRAAVANAVRHDVVVVAAAGNSHAQGDPTPYPAAYPGVIGVAAVGADGQRAPDSQVGPYVDVAAAGVDITAAARQHGLATYSGTSFAAPFVSATAALIRQRWPDLSAAEVAARILATTDRAPGSLGYGRGLLDPVRAVTARTDPAPSQALAPVVGLPTRAPVGTRSHQQKVVAMAVAGLGVLGTVAITLIAAAWPRGRTRRWRTG